MKLKITKLFRKLLPEIKNRLIYNDKRNSIIKRRLKIEGVITISPDDIKRINQELISYNLKIYKHGVYDNNQYTFHLSELKNTDNYLY